MRRSPFHLILSACLAMTLVLPSCSGGDDNNQQRQQTTTRTNTNTTIQTNGSLGDGLDLSRLPSLVQKAKNGEELEEILNTSGVNNLDTNNDGKVDFLNVEEVREKDNNGFVLYTNEGSERLEIAKIDISTTQETASVAVQGNPQYYGQQPVQYRSSFPLTEILLAAWLFDIGRPRFGHSGYRYGSYPKYYKTSRVMPMASYRTKVGSGSLTVKGQPLRAAASRRTTGGTSTLSTGSNSRTMNGGTSFSTTTNKRPAGSVSNSTGFGSNSSRSGATGTGSSTSTGSTRFGNDTNTRSSTGSGAFGSSSNRRKPSFSFGGSSGSSTSSSSRSSGFGSSSRRSSSGGRRRR